MGKEKGFVLIEIMVGLVLLVIIGLAFYAGLMTMLRTTLLTQERTTAESLAKSQMEVIRNSEFKPDGDYELIEKPDGYEFVINHDNRTAVTEGDIQKVSVTVKHNDKDVLTLETFKAK